MKNKKIVFGFIILVLVIIGILVVKKNRQANNLEEENNSNYIVITDAMIETMTDDGGSYTDQYYEVSLSNNRVEFKEDYYNNSFIDSAEKRERESYTGKLLETIIINEKQKKKLQELFNEILQNQEDLQYSDDSDYVLSFENIIRSMTEEQKEQFLDIISEK